MLATFHSQSIPQRNQSRILIVRRKSTLNCSEISNFESFSSNEVKDSIKILILSRRPVKGKLCSDKALELLVIKSMELHCHFLPIFIPYHRPRAATVKRRKSMLVYEHAPICGYLLDNVIILAQHITQTLLWKRFISIFNCINCLSFQPSAHVHIFIANTYMQMGKIILSITRLRVFRIAARIYIQWRFECWLNVNINIPN